MRYKNNVINRLEQAEATIQRVEMMVNRGMSQDDILDTIEVLKEHVDGVKEMVSVEPDDFEQQFTSQ